MFRSRIASWVFAVGVALTLVVVSACGAGAAPTPTKVPPSPTTAAATPTPTKAPPTPTPAVVRSWPNASRVKQLEAKLDGPGVYGGILRTGDTSLPVQWNTYDARALPAYGRLIGNMLSSLISEGSVIGDTQTLIGDVAESWSLS